MSAEEEATFNEHHYCSLFLTRLNNAKESREKLEILQTELQFLQLSNPITELAERVQLELQMLNSSDNEQEEKVHEEESRNDDLEKDGSVAVKVGAGSGEALKDVLYCQKLKLLQLENLLADDDFINIDKGHSATSQIPFAIKTKKLFNSSGHSMESEPYKESKISEQELILEKDREEQEKLTEVLSKQAQMIMEISKATSEKLKSESSRLDDLDEKLLNNENNVKRERGALQKISSSSWMTTIMIWGGILLGILIFLWAFLYIRMVSPTRIQKVVFRTETIVASSFSSTESTSTATVSSVSSTTSASSIQDHHDFDWDEL